MEKRDKLICVPTSWRGRRGYSLGNGLVSLVTLLGGGHIAEFRFQETSGLPSLNPLWIPPWKTIDPDRYRPLKHASLYGSVTSGAKLLAGITGHNLCLDYFGVPSPEEYESGLSDHGEAPNSRWHKLKLSVSDRQVALTLAVNLPAAGLGFTRQIRLLQGESVAYFEEMVTNRRELDHFFHWVQHVTLGPPFLSASKTSVAFHGTRGKTSPGDYEEGKPLLACDRKFRWPFAPAAAGGKVDLRRTLTRRGRGFVVGVLVDPQRDNGFVAALNARHHLLIGYCFRRSDYPWVTIWEENRAIAARPWGGRTETRGLEFGTTPLALRRREAYALGRLFDTPTLDCVPAHGRRTVHYAAFLATVPRDFDHVRDVRVEKDRILVFGGEHKSPVILPARGLSHTNLVSSQ